MKPEIAILDMDMPIMSGMEGASLIKQNAIHTKAIYVTKNTTLEELDTCIKEVSAGYNYISPKSKGTLGLANSELSTADLTATEIKILKLQRENLTSKQLADQLLTSKRTVEKHRSNIIKKSDLGSRRNDLVLWLKDNGHLFD